jgi:hypothetical protein
MEPPSWFLISAYAVVALDLKPGRNEVKNRNSD